MFTELFSPEIIEVNSSSELLRVWDPQRLEIGIKAFANEYSYEQPRDDYWTWIKQRMEDASPTIYPFWFTDERTSLPNDLIFNTSVEEWRDSFWLFVQGWHIRMRVKAISPATSRWCKHLWSLELSARTLNNK